MPSSQIHELIDMVLFKKRKRHVHKIKDMVGFITPHKNKSGNIVIGYGGHHRVLGHNLKSDIMIGMFSAICSGSLKQGIEDTLSGIAHDITDHLHSKTKKLTKKYK